MKLGSSQSEKLTKLVETRVLGDEDPSIVIGVRPWRKIHRGPAGHPIVAFIKYPNGDVDGWTILSDVNNREDAEIKAAKFARHLVDEMKVPAGRVKCQRLYNALPREVNL